MKDKSSEKSTRQHILDTAADLFFREGYRAIGVDTIVERSGVAKMTLYRYFPSKDDLIAAYLEQTNTRFWQWFDALVAPHPDSPRDQLIAVFDGVSKLATSPECYGCAFINAAAEFADFTHRGHDLARLHKQAVLDRFRLMAEKGNAANPEELAAQLLMLMDGAWIQARMFGPLNAAKHVPQMARTLITAHFGA